MVLQRVPNGYYTEETVRNDIRVMYDNGESITAKSVKGKRSTLYVKALEIYGSWEDVLKEVGVTWEEVYEGRKPNGYWTKSRVKVELKKRKKEGKGLTYNDMILDDNVLYYGVISIYGNLEKALKDIGVDPLDYLMVNPKGYWTRDRVITELWRRKSEGISLQPSDIRDYNIVLANRIIELFGDWNAAYEVIEEDASKHLGKRLNRAWSPDVVIGELLERRRNVQSIEASGVHREDISLYRNGLKYYGTWQDVLIAVEKEL